MLEQPHLREIMRNSNFYKLKWEVKGISKILSQIAQHPELWNRNRLRTTGEITPHKDSSDIWLRFNDIKAPAAEYLREEIFSGKEMINYPAMELLTKVRPLLHELMYRVNGERLGRVLITKLPSGGYIRPHMDEGSTALYYDRFHIVLHEGGTFYCGDEIITMPTGTVWWFNNQRTHSVINSYEKDRIHLIVDIKIMDYSPFYSFKRHEYRVEY